MDISKIPVAAFDQILDLVRQKFPGSHPVIGGGAIRDSIHGRPIKDVDVFLRHKDHPFGLDSDLTKKLHAPFIARMYGRPDMHGAWDLVQSVAGYEVQLILADFEDLIELAGTFDLGLSRATFDGRELYLHPDFIQDSQEKVFRICRGDNDYEIARTEKRIDRLSLKYPEFSRAA